MSGSITLEISAISRPFVGSFEREDSRTFVAGKPALSTFSKATAFIDS